MKHLAILTLGAFCLGGVDSFAKDAPPATPLTETLASVSAAELPAKIAALVKEAKSRDRRTTTITVVKAAVGIRPAAALAIVGAVARAVPEMTPDAAGTAAAEQPKLVGMIAKAAAAAAPSQAGKIVVAVCRAVPNEY